MYLFDQDFNMSKIENIPSEAKISKLSSMRMEITWLANKRPAIVFKISKIEQVAWSMYGKDMTKNWKRLGTTI